ncbi:hypothetical protein ACJRO7_024667 [Eucalyptus globulus]|uniref:Staygreen protein domain-containing protein n=1 Tax=Eucalyptus globulus TaxID=34317 RepID=A0ABD3K9K2_EUCGL
MASHFAPSAFSPTPNAGVSQLRSPRRPPPPPAVLCVQCYRGSPYNTLVSEAVRLLVPPARFEASKLKVDFTGGESDNYSGIIPRTYILSHCDFTANLNLTISNVISLDQLRGWYEKDDVVAEWKSVNKEMCLHIHCFVSGPNPFLDLAAEFRYHIFSKEMPLVLKAVLHGDALLFTDHPELMDAPVWVYFHSSSQKYNRIECWGPFKDAAQREQIQGFFTGSNDDSPVPRKWRGPKSIFQALFAFLL